jgi:hypothetical protein
MEKGVLMQERLCGYRNGRDPQLLDLIEIEFLAPQQHPFQPENHVINLRSRWQHRGTGSCKDALPAVENVKGPLWANVGSSKHGQNDEIPQEVAPGLKNSLKLVQTDELVVRVKMEGRQVQRWEAQAPWRVLTGGLLVHSVGYGLRNRKRFEDLCSGHGLA